jgi:CxxC motif-containing protein
VEIKNMTCIVCPFGCKLQVRPLDVDGMEFDIKGNKCPKGLDYAVKELRNPTRVITSTVKIKYAHLNRLPVRTSEAIAKNLMFKCMKKLDFVEVKSPVKAGDVIIRDILGTGINIIATRSM